MSNVNLTIDRGTTLGAEKSADVASITSIGRAFAAPVLFTQSSASHAAAYAQFTAKIELAHHLNGSPHFALAHVHCEPSNTEHRRRSAIIHSTLTDTIAGAVYDSRSGGKAHVFISHSNNAATNTGQHLWSARMLTGGHAAAVAPVITIP